MVACAAISAQPSVLLAASMTACAVTVEQLKQQLLTAVENGNADLALSTIAELERAVLTKEVLEKTRIGATVNDVRKRSADTMAVLSKRCRALIKQWQKLIEHEAQPHSTTSSANGTPNLISPATFGRRVTPCTPGGRRVTSSSAHTPAIAATLSSPANGSYAPKSIVSPMPMHKSQSVGAELLKQGEEHRNGKRKAEEPPLVNGGGSMKRTKTVASSLGGANASPATPSVMAARRMNVQSTSDLVAQLSSNLPTHMHIDNSLREHEERVKREQADEELAMTLQSTAPGSVTASGKRKYVRKLKPDMTPTTPSTSEEKTHKPLILRLPRLGSTPSVERIQEEEDVVVSRPASANGRGVDWMAMLPSLDQLRSRAEQRVRPEPLKHDPTKLYLMKVRDRDVLALPYLDTTVIPDFMHFRYQEPTQYYAEENFMYGAPRP